MALSSLAQKRLFILGSLVVVLLAVLLYLRINALVNSYKAVDHTNRVERNLEYALSYLKDAETGQRGFLLSRKLVFLEPYHGARARIDSVLHEVDSLIEDSPRQQQNLSSLRFMIDQRFDLLEKGMQDRDTLNENLYVDMARGKSSMDRIREHISRMEGDENEVLRQRERTKNRYLRLTPVSLLFLVFAMLIIIGFSYNSLTKQLRRTKEYAANLDYLNKELVLKNKQLENSVEELNSFNYIASHDLKEPLRKILFFTDIINKPNKTYQIPDEVKGYLEKINTSGERMKSLLEDLLTYAQSSMMERKLEPVDLNALVATVVENFSEQLKESKARIQFSGLPHLQAVPSQMQQLFENLISNSLKYRKAHVPPEITITAHTVSRSVLPPALEATHDSYQQIRFSDNGIGFTQENAEKIFVLFQRLHQRNEFTGTGIGLTICRKIVQNHNGFITAESEVNEGTTFFIYLPA